MGSAPRVDIFGFLSTPSGWRATLKSVCISASCFISIHALRVEGDLSAGLLPIGANQYFYPRPPGGGRPPTACCVAYFSRNFYPRPPGGGRQNFVLYFVLFNSISIHALRVEGDVALPEITSAGIYFYPRPPGGGRRITPCRASPCRRFLSTPSGWRATGWSRAFGRAAIQISIHALRVEGDAFKQLFCIKSKIFLSTPSGWRATCR